MVLGIPVLILSMVPMSQTAGQQPAANKVATPPRLVRKVEPVYPALANVQHLEGEVKLGVVIGKDGRMVLVKASSGPSLFYPAAEEAVRQWEYQPGTLDGVPVDVSTTITVRFGGSEPAPHPVQTAPVKPTYVLPPPDAARPRISSVLMLGRVTRRVAPVYPSSPTPSPVVMRVMVGKDGKVQDVIPVAGPEDLRGPAADAVRQWEFQPYLLNGNPAEVETVLTIRPDLGG